MRPEQHTLLQELLHAHHVEDNVQAILDVLRSPARKWGATLFTCPVCSRYYERLEETFPDEYVESRVP